MTPTKLSLQRWLPLACTLLCVAFLATACGGGSGPEHATAARDGIVYPAREGVEFVELAADGRVVQRSTPSDRSGRFSFERPVSGVRIAALVEHPMQQPEVFSARFGQERRSIVVTPLTTMFDQLIEEGETRAAAEQRVLAILTAACRQPDASIVRASLHADGPAPLLMRARPLIHAIGAHFRALRAVGLAQSAIRQTASVPHRLEVLRQQCALAEQVLSPGWIGSSILDIAGRLSVDDPRSLLRIPLPIDDLTEEVLRLLDDRMRVHEHPQIAPLLAPTLQAWEGREAEVAAELLFAYLIAESVRVDGPARIPDSVIAGSPYRPGARYALSPDGRVVETQRQRVQLWTDRGPELPSRFETRARGRSRCGSICTA
jgi:hypothetical protein